ncbi:hypothetical protein AWC38_SpisGene22134 [Stylophora pistillata]|uniref:Uncharacterized protein n=1 Tax=Stylophora pistillata TaxID=50429 RepID=A0A2B4RBK3_STYPI|nr:hypothetical protein AWC38_SpisGene22134 [Stylophora pistillata]
MFAVKEERTVIGGVELARKTVVAATGEGVPAVAYPSAPPALPPPPPQPMITAPPSPKGFSWMECCFKCDDQHEWYQLGGKGFCFVLLLLLAYVVAGGLILAYFGTSFMVEMDDGKDTTGVLAVGAEHNAETAFNSLPLKTAECTTVSASSYPSPAVSVASPSSDCSVQRCDYPKRKKQELDLPLFRRHFGVSFAQNFHPKYDSKASTF